MSDTLPSIDDLLESKLPSVDDFIKEEKELPSVNDFIEEEEKEEIVDTAPCSIEEEAQDLTEIVRLINDVRKDIPDIPEIKYYDNELEKLSEQVELVRDSIPEIPEIKYYDEEIASLREEIDRNAADIPEIKYYDDQVNDLEEKIKVIKEDIVNLPEPKYYEADLQSLKEDILAVKESVPVFPKWVNEVNEVPDFSWIGKTFGVIDSDFVKVNDNLESIRGRIDQEVQEISENFDLKDFENKVEFEKASNNLKETKGKIYEELRETALRIWDHHKEFKDDDRKLKKQILSHYNVLKQKVDEEVKEFNRKTVESKDLFKGYFDGLSEEIENLPKPKYYDDTINNLRKDVNRSISKLTNKHEDTTLNVSELYKLVEELKEKQQELIETNVPLGEDPPEVSNKDPLTPIDQNFVTLDQLQQHYKLFVERVQYQLGSIGGGGAGFIKDLDDVTHDGTNNELLIYNSSTSKWVGIASTALSSSSEIAGISTTGTSVFNQLSVTGVSTFTKNISVEGSLLKFGDSSGVTDDRIVLGNGSDFHIYHPGTDSMIDNNTGNLILRCNVNADVGGNIKLQPKAGEEGIVVIHDGSVELYEDNTKRFETTGDGAKVTGELEVTGNVSVAGTITYEDVTNVDSVGVGTFGGGIKLGRSPSVAAIESATSTKTSTSEASVDTFTASTYRSAQYQIQVTRGSQYHVTTMNLLHDGTNVFMSEFGTIKTGVSLATFDADINSGNVRLLATPSSSDSTVFKMVKNLTLT